MTSQQTVQERSLTTVREGAVEVVEFSEGHYNNPFPRWRMRELTELFTAIEEDPAVQAIVLYGGAGRSFCVGGDFNETSEFVGGDEVDAWIDDITDLYLALLSTTKPVVAAVDGYAIGVGLQMVLTTDYRIGSEACVLKMPEFDLGIACNFGGYMLTEVVGRSVMQNMLFSCEEWPARRALEDGLLHGLVAADRLRDHAVECATRFAGYSREPLRMTKPHLNARYIEGLNRVREEAKESHRRGFAVGAAQSKMRRVIHAD